MAYGGHAHKLKEVGPRSSAKDQGVIVLPSLA